MDVVTTATPQATVTITVEQLREFEAAVAEVAVLKAKRAKRVTNKLADVRAFDAAHPEIVAERQRKYNISHREELNTKRRERRRLARKARLATEPPGGSEGRMRPLGRSKVSAQDRNQNECPPPTHFVPSTIL